MKEYLKDRSRSLLMAFVIGAIFFIYWIFAGFELKHIYYPFLLCLFVGLIVLGMDYARWKKRHDAFEQIHSADEVFSIPRGTTVKDQDYLRMISLLEDKIAELKTEMNVRSEDQTDYYATWVHQIKTPIAALKLRIQNEDSEFSRQVRMEVRRIEQYVDMVMAYQRLEAESSDFVLKRCSLDECIRGAIRNFAGEFILRRIRLEYEPVETEKLTDSKWLGFVLEQILANALKYTNEGSVRIYMRDENTLCIEDTGIGIAKEDLPRIFEKGYTGYNGRTGASASGLGLHLCQKVCDGLGHRIYASSEVGKGTCISIVFFERELFVD